MKIDMTYDEAKIVVKSIELEEDALPCKKCPLNKVSECNGECYEVVLSAARIYYTSKEDKPSEKPFKTREEIAYNFMKSTMIYRGNDVNIDNIKYCFDLADSFLEESKKKP